MVLWTYVFEMVLSMWNWMILRFWMVFVFVIVISALVDIVFLVVFKYELVCGWALLVVSKSGSYLRLALTVVFISDWYVGCALRLFSNRVWHTTDQHTCFWYMVQKNGHKVSFVNIAPMRKQSALHKVILWAIIKHHV